MGGTQILVHGIYREKIPRYMIYRSTCFLPFSPKFGQFLNSQSKTISNWSSNRYAFICYSTMTDY